MNKWPSKEEVNYIKMRYPEGTRIRLNYMKDSQAVPSGTEGSVVMVDSIGQIHMKWDNGRTLALVPDEDSFSVIPQKQAQGMVMQMGGL